jgi:hypothetical protein
MKSWRSAPPFAKNVFYFFIFVLVISLFYFSSSFFLSRVIAENVEKEFEQLMDLCQAILEGCVNEQQGVEKGKRVSSLFWFYQCHSLNTAFSKTF